MGLFIPIVFLTLDSLPLSHTHTLTHTVTQTYARHDQAKDHITIIIWARSLKGEHHVNMVFKHHTQNNCPVDSHTLRN